MYLYFGSKRILSSWSEYLVTMYFSNVFAEKKTVCFLNNLHEDWVPLVRYSCHLIVEMFSEQLNPKNNVIPFFVQSYQKNNSVSTDRNIT